MSGVSPVIRFESDGYDSRLAIDRNQWPLGLLRASRPRWEFDVATPALDGDHPLHWQMERGYADISSSLNPLPARRFQRSDSSPARVSDHVLLAHLLSASASWWAIRGVMPIHSTDVPNARMTLPPLAVTAYRSSPSSSGVRAPWANLPVSPSGVPCARVSAFIAWIVSATVACCTASLNHRSPWCSSSCIMVSIRARSLDVSSVELDSDMAKRALALPDTKGVIHEKFYQNLHPRTTQGWKAASWSPLVVVTVRSLSRTFCSLGRRPTQCGFHTEGSQIICVCM